MVGGGECGENERGTERVDVGVGGPAAVVGARSRSAVIHAPPLVTRHVIYYRCAQFHEAPANSKAAFIVLVT